LRAAASFDLKSVGREEGGGTRRSRNYEGRRKSDETGGDADWKVSGTREAGGVPADSAEDADGEEGDEEV